MFEVFFGLVFVGINLGNYEYGVVLIDGLFDEGFVLIEV